MKLSTKILLVLLIIVVAAAVWGYFASAFPAPLPAYNRTAKETTSPQSAVTPALEASMGHPFSYGTVLYSISKIDRVKELKRGTTSLATSGDFLLVFLSVKNQGWEPLTFTPSDFALYDSQGRKFTVQKDATELVDLVYKKEDLFDEAIQPGLERQGALAFAVPKEATGLSLRLFNGYLDVSLDL